MKLRSRFPLVQLLSATGCALLLCSPAQAQHKVVLKNGQAQSLNVTGVSGGNLQVQAGSATVAIPLNTVSSVEMPAPAELVAGRAAMQSKDYPKALVALKGVVEKYKGMPCDWTREASAMVGEVYLALNDEKKAEAAYDEYQKAYPGQSTTQGDLGLARLAIAKKDYDGADAKLRPILEKASATLLPPPDSAVALSQAFYLSGQLKEAKGDKQGALEDYLRTVTIYSDDQLAVAGARERADALRKKEKVISP